MNVRDPRYIAHSLAGVIPHELLLGKDGDREQVMKAMVSDEVIEELKRIAYHSNGHNRIRSSETKENYNNDDREWNYHLENNAQDNSNNIRRNISQTLTSFKNNPYEPKSAEIHYNQGMRKSESFQPLGGMNYMKKSSSNSSESETGHSNNGMSPQVYDSQYRGGKSNIYEKSVRNTSHQTMKSITNKSNNSKQNKSAKKSTHTKFLKNNAGQVNSKKSKGMNEKMNVVPLNGYVPDIIQSEIYQRHK